MDKEMLDRLESKHAEMKAWSVYGYMMSINDVEKLIIAARELAFLFKCNGENVVGGHEPIMHSGCCPLCTEIGDYNELQSELAELRGLTVSGFDHNTERGSCVVMLDWPHVGGLTLGGTLGEALDAAKGKQ